MHIFADRLHRHSWKQYIMSYVILQAVGSQQVRAVVYSGACVDRLSNFELRAPAHPAQGSTLSPSQLNYDRVSSDLARKTLAA
jgi:hypothetical protein